MTTMSAPDAWSTVPADTPSPSSDTTDDSDSGPRLLAIRTRRPARSAVRAMACPSRPAPMIPTVTRSSSSIMFLRRIRTRTGSSRPGSDTVATAPPLGPPKFEHRNGADSSSLAFVLGKAWVAPRLLSVDPVAFSAGQFADGHLVCLGSAFDTAATGGGQVVVPVRVGGGSTLGCEDVDAVRLGVGRQVHRRGDVLPPAFAAAVMQQDHRSALEVPADPALVRSELRDGVRVPVEPLGHVELLSFTIRGRRWDQVMEGPAAVPGDQVFDLVLPGSGAGFEPAACGL